jgi:hypothetical protein
MTAARNIEQSLFPNIAPDKPVGPLPLSVQTGTNADLMWAIRDLYLTGSVLDVTYGRGGWWQRFQPDPFTAHDLYKLDGVDFRHLPEADQSVDTVCFDPPYVLHGRIESSRVPEFADAYGLGTKWEGRDGFDDLTLSGLTECLRVARRFVLVKCMEFAQGGRFHDIPTLLINHAATFDLTLHDRLIHFTGTGPGGHNIYTPKRTRRAHSYLLVFKVPA